MAYYAVYNTNTKELVSTGTVLADPLPGGLTSKTLTATEYSNAQSGYIWDKVNLTFVPNPTQLADEGDILTTVDPITYYASPEGGRNAFNITTDVVTITQASEQPLAVLENPTGSGKDIYLDTGEFASNVNTQFRRYSGPTISSRGTAKIPRNMSGGSNTSPLRFYPAGQFTLSNNGTVTKTAQIPSYQQYKTQIKGKVILRPGSAVYWTIDQPTGGTQLKASIYFEYWQKDAE